MPDSLECSPPQDQVCLITDDGTPLTQALVTALEQKGWQQIVILVPPVELIQPSKIKSKTAHSFTLKNADESSLTETLNQIQQAHGPISSFIHLHPRVTSDLSAKERFSSSEKQVLKLIFLVAKHLAKPLNKAAASHRATFMTVTRINGKLGYQFDSDASPVAGGLFGLLKTANIEWEPVFCRALDLSPEISDTEASEKIISEMSDSDCRISEVGHTPTERFTLTAMVQSVDEQDQLTAARIETSSVFLVSGGGKGVTASCVIELAKQYQCGFILLGRSEIPADEPDWAKGCSDDKELKKRCMEAFIAAGEKPTPMKISGRLKQIVAGREIQKTLYDIQTAGAKAVYLSADINDAKALKTKLAPVVKKLGEITGIIHGAGVLADNLIEKKTAADFEAVYKTKISGLNTLLNMVSIEKLAYLVLFSSAAGFYGNEAQADYAAANEILNKFSHSFKHHYPACHVIANNWGPWDGGMVTPELKKLFEQREVDIIPIPVGAKMMADGLKPVFGDIPQVVIGSSMTIPRQLTPELDSYRITKTLSLAANPFLNDHAIDGEPVLPLIVAISWMTDSCARLYPGYHFQSIENAQVFKGVVFKDSADKEFVIDLKETLKDNEAGMVTFEVRVSSQNPQGKPVFHYGSQIVLSSKKNTLPPLTVPEFQSADAQPADELYENGTLFHGPIFRNVTHLLQLDREKLMLKCHTPESGQNQWGQFPLEMFNYFAEDTCLQALLIWAREFHGAGSLPLKIQKGEFIKPIPFAKDFFISMTIEESSSSKVSATVTAHDESGEIYSRFIGAEAAISKNLNKKFKQ